MINTVLFSLKRYEFQKIRNCNCEHRFELKILEINLKDKNHRYFRGGLKLNTVYFTGHITVTL